MFSIIMPVWDRADVVSQSIESVLSQTFDDYELIIVDDGSQDNLETVVDPYLSEKVAFYKRSHLGVSAARNFGLKQAKGNFIAYLDSDVLWHPEFISSMWSALHEGESLKEAAYCRYNYFVKDPQTGVLRFDGVMGEEFNFRKLVEGNYIDINTFVHSKRCTDIAGLWDESLRRLVDWDYILRITSVFEPVFVPQVLVDYYMGVAKNAISLNEDLSPPLEIIKAKNKRFHEPIKICHDTITYSWPNLADKKYYNFIKMNGGAINTVDFTANGFPYMLQIEVTNFCNLSCPLCPSGNKTLGRERRHLKLDEFKSIIDDLGDYLLILIMWDWGEPLLNPDLPAMIRYASSKGIKTVTSTNGQNIDDAHLTDLITSGLSTLIVAIDSLYEDNYETYRKGGKLNRALNGLKRAIELKRELNSNILINMRMVVMKQNETEISPLREASRQMGVDIFSVKTVNPSCDSSSGDEGIVPVNPAYQRYEYIGNTYQRVRINALCPTIWGMCNIHSNGNVVPCCYDYDGSMVVGNIREQRLSEIWNGPVFRELRKKIHNDKQALRKCRDCGSNFKPSSTGWFVESINFVEDDLRSAMESISLLEEQLRGSSEKIGALEMEISNLDHILRDMESSAVWNLLNKFQYGLVDPVMPPGTTRRKLYDRGIRLCRQMVCRVP